MFFNTALTMRFHKVIYFILTEELKVLLVIFEFLFDQQSSKNFMTRTKLDDTNIFIILSLI